MRFRIKKDEFLKGLSRVQSVADRKNTMPILSNVLIECTEGGIALTATDLEIGMRGVYKAEVEQEGGLTLSARKLYEIVRELPEEDVLVESAENNWATIRSGAAHFKFTGLAKEEFPALPEIEEASLIPVDREIMHELIKKTIYASGDNDTRYVLNGLFLNLVPKGDTAELMMVGTDGHRLAVMNRTIKVSAGALKEEASAIIPKKSASELKKLLDEGEGSFHMALSKNHVVFKIDSIYMVSRLIEGKYPNYKQVMPPDNDKEAVAKKGPLVAALKRVSLLSRERTNAVKLSLSKDKALLSSQNPEMGEADEEISLEYDHPDIEVGFNARYLLDVFSVIDNDKVNLLFKDSLSPCVITQEGDKDYKCVVMPLRV